MSDHILTEDTVDIYIGQLLRLGNAIPTDAGDSCKDLTVDINNKNLHSV